MSGGFSSGGTDAGGGGGNGNNKQPQGKNSSNSKLPCVASTSNNPHLTRNLLIAAVGGAGILGTTYTVFALANMEDGVGEVMLALRAAQVARFGEGAVMLSNALGFAASLGGATDAATAFLNGGGIGASLGAAGGLLVTPATCPGS